MLVNIDKTYFLLSGVIFCLVALLHAIRVINGYELVIGPWNAPMFVSWIGTIGPGLLSVWAFALARKC
jgi:hypothetical protein